MMKRGIIGICILFVVICVFVTQTDFPEEKDSAGNGEITLKWMVYGEKYQESEQVMARFNEKLHEYLPGISVELEIVSREEYKNTWDVKMAGGDELDIAWIGSDVVNYTEEVKKGSFMALDYLLSAEGEELYQGIPQDLWEKQRRDGNIYAIPVLGPLYRKNLVLVADKNLMDRYGDFEEILRVNQEQNYTNKTCFEVMEPFLEKVKENRAMASGVSYQTLCMLADKGYEGIYGEDSPFVIRIFDDYPTVYNKYELESYRACFETMADWYQKGYIREDVAYLLDPSSQDGKILGNILFVTEYGENKTVYDYTEPEYEAVMGELDGYRYISYETCRNCLVIPKTARHPREAIQVLNLLHTEEGKELYRILANGIEGEQYIRVSRDSEVIARMTDNDRNYRYCLDAVNVGNIFQNYEGCEGQFDTVKQYNEEAIQSPLRGFELDTRMFALELSRVDLVTARYLEELCRGTSEDWESLYEEFLEEMKAAGSEKVIEEVQKQIDSFMEKK